MDAFGALLKFLYTGAEPKYIRGDSIFAKKMRIMADQCECTFLKLYAKSDLEERFLDPSNTADMLLFADAHSCALLKESAMDVYAIDPRTVKESEGYTQLMESKDLIVELLEHTNGGRGSYIHIVEQLSEEDVNNLDVTSLREQLQSVDIDVDGSKPILVKRWIPLRSALTFKILTNPSKTLGRS